MEDQQNSERSDHLDEIGSDPAIELAKSMPLYSPLRVPWCTDPSPEFFHFPFDIDTYSSISTMSSPPDFDGVFSDGLHGINTASSIRVTTYHLVLARVAKVLEFDISGRLLLHLETLKQLLVKQYKDPAVSIWIQARVWIVAARRLTLEIETLLQKFGKPYKDVAVRMSPGAPCWGSANELEVHPPSLLLPCLTESTAQDNLAQPRSLTHHEAKSNGGELTPLTTYGEKIVSTNKSCIVIHHPEKKNTIETQRRKCRTDLGEDQPIEVTEFHNGKKLCSIQCGRGMVLLDPLNQQSMDPPINSGRNGGSGEQRDNVVTYSQEKPKCKHRIQISLEAIQQQRGRSRMDAANCLKVSQSTLKRICRKYGIDDWRRIKKDNHSRPIEFVQGVDQEQILKSSSNVPSMQASAIVAHTKLPDTAMQDANMVSIKAKYASDIIIKFELSFPYKLVELQQQVAKRLNLEAGTYYIKYKDEDNDLILIACDDDLERLCTCRLQGSSSIEVFLQPK